MMECSVKNRERILEAIDQLRRRKARPDIQRICNYLFRRFSINSAEARNDLQWCVENDIVLKVEYKGSISYRNAAKKYSHIKRDVTNDNPSTLNNNSNSNNNNNINNNRKFVQLLTNAFSELIVNEPDYLETGVPADKIIQNILAKDSVRYTKKYISILIDQEVDNGGLIRMDGDKYLMGPKDTEHIQTTNSNVNNKMVQSPVSSTSCNSGGDNLIKNKSKLKPKLLKKNTNGNVEEQGDDNKKNDKNEQGNSLRVGGRRKRARKVFDPSDTHIPKKRGRPAGSLNKTTIEKQLSKVGDEPSRPESRTSNSGSSRDQFGVCSVCHSTNKKGPNDRLIACRECSNKAHFSCLNGEDMMLRMHPDNTWQCPYCKTCVVCYETSNAGYLIVCAVCADAYHASCHQPRVSEKIKTNMRWLCINCEMPDELKINEIQPNIPLSQKSNNSTSNDINDSSPSISVNTSPYQSPSLSPTPPHLSPELNQENYENGDGMSDSQSNKDSDDDNSNIDPTIPDASNWTYEEVYQYFAQYFPEEAHIFRDQEIDGRSLLLLKRMDVLTNLKLKLGPALKIYRHVVKLQVRRDDPKMYWL